MKFNHSKLLGRIRERGLTQKAIAKAINMTQGTLSLKINGLSQFTTEEIRKICEQLDISPLEAGAYFFTK